MYKLVTRMHLQLPPQSRSPSHRPPDLVVDSLLARGEVAGETAQAEANVRHHRKFIIGW